MRRKVYILESFYFKGVQIPNHELPETMGFNDQLSASFFRKKKKDYFTCLRTRTQ